ncbi:binding-protein-dependent transport systems inner membrane component [Desulfofarcimen acetoxidans DSM 771]|uniref:Binding-protein-dependent transport systems inner membrane component n=1 Tax=Desulfofarcimen acetoxidans (strain ATCC 49208 / DSM 771 / KCTC 5769 / VKM B-1644 / 5575) TaxID=485916 RepID=C8W5Y1_DESAS|nr:proline/glycine betaine ABC transporter permease [Desulfofarcimen acetoxidans]ACV61436.1 binding-protein-dependent transport systems inner membrane component [Desulfofarcimen acetoxidans DSM 771]
MLPKIPIGDWIESVVEIIGNYFGPLFDIITGVINFLVGSLYELFIITPAPIFIVLVMAFIWVISKRIVLSIGSGLGLLLIYNLQLWVPSMETLALVLSATFFALIISFPIGILTARSGVFHKAVMPVLDLMQTMPPFVYLVPAVIFFQIGNVPGLIATIIFAMPPVIRLTGLGIRQVPVELIEAAEAFGSTPGQKLVKVQIPLALPTIMAGVNQCILLALSMVVIAAMIGAGGLGSVVLRGIQRLQVGVGFEGGLAIVIIAIILDRITQSLSKKNKT